MTLFIILKCCQSLNKKDFLQKFNKFKETIFVQIVNREELHGLHRVMEFLFAFFARAFIEALDFILRELDL